MSMPVSLLAAESAKDLPDFFPYSLPGSVEIDPGQGLIFQVKRHYDANGLYGKAGKSASVGLLDTEGLDPRV